MKKLAWILLTVLCLPFLNAQVKNTTNNQNKPNNEVQIQRNIEFPRVHVFDPSAVPDVWVEPERENHEVMPEPGAINHPLRKKIDAKRDALTKNNVNKRAAFGSPKTSPETLKPVIEDQFDGRAGSGTPNDNHVAVGNDGKFISVMNTTIRVHDDTGKVLKLWSLQFFPSTQNKVDNIPSLTRIYDPRVMYDPYSDRYMVLYMHGTTDKTSFIVVAFSQSNDPTKPWNVYKIPGKPIQDTVWSDYPIVSQTKEDLFFTVNLLANGSSWEEGFREAVIWQLRKEDGFAGQTLRTNFFNGIKHQGVSIWSICPVQNGPWPDGTDNYFLSVRPYAEKNDTVFMHRITNTQKSGIAEYELKVLKSNLEYGFPSSAMQPDSFYKTKPDSAVKFKLRTNDARVLTAIRNGNQIQFMQNCLNFKTLQAHIMHSHIYHIDQDLPVVKSKLYTDDTLEFGYPAMAFAGTENNDPSMISTAVYSSRWHMPGFGMFYQNRYGEYSKFIPLKAGESRISYNILGPDEQRWGDYEGIQWKYNEPGVFYLIGSYGKNNEMNNFVSRVRISDHLYTANVQDLKVFPVPSDQGYFNIEWMSKTPEVLRGEIYSIDGKGPGSNRVSGLSVSGDASGGIYQPGSFEFYTLEGVHVYRVHTRNYAAGTYLIRLWRGEELVGTQKVVIY